MGVVYFLTTAIDKIDVSRRLSEIHFEAVVDQKSPQPASSE